MPAPSIGDWAAVGGAVFTAAAAYAAFLTARQGRKALEAAERPKVEVQVMVQPSDLMLRLSIINAGRGLARSVSVMVYAEGKRTDTVVGTDGFLQPGEKAHVLTEIGPVSTPVPGAMPGLGVTVVYRDGQDFVHYRTHQGREYVPKALIGRGPKYPTRITAFKRLFPNLAVDSAQDVASRSLPPGP